MRGTRFTFVGLELDQSSGTVAGTYDADGVTFVERWSVGDGGDLGAPGVRAAAEWLYLLAGVSYYKATVAPVLDTGSIALDDTDAAFLRSFYVDGLAEFAYRNGLDLDDLVVEGPRAPRVLVAVPHVGTPRALVPFGGGIDSIVTVDAVQRAGVDASLFICAKPGDTYAAIEAPAAVTGLPILRATRQLDPTIFETSSRGWWNGHVPITGVLSALAVVTALCHGFSMVVMSNEHSASDPNVVDRGRAINHQWSKSEHFERGFRAVLERSIGDAVDFSSYLRARSELWVAERFAELRAYHPVFRSCNKAFFQHAEQRLAEWCGECDKCCFIDLVLAPFLSPDELGSIFGGREPLRRADLAPVFATLCGLSPQLKPFECVGDVTECAAAATLAAARADRAADATLQSLAATLHLDAAVVEVLRYPLGEDAVPSVLRG